MRDAGFGFMVAVALLAFVLLGGGLLGGPTEAAAAGGETDFVGLTPCRLADTRGNGFGGAYGPPALVAGAPRSFLLHGQCAIPTTAVAVSLNVTATNTLGQGFLLLFPEGGAQPVVSTLNYVAGETVANAAIVPLGAGGLTVVAGVAGTDLILDVNGYFEDGLVHDVDVDNTFVGLGAGNLSTTGQANTAVGARLLSANTTGNFNTATGVGALRSNTTGNDNSAIGVDALGDNTAGISNTAIGSTALRRSTGARNTGVGAAALFFATGSDNTALGAGAGVNATTGSFNVYLANEGVAAEGNTIRIGSGASQTRAFVAGVRDVTTDLNDAGTVFIASNGQLGTASSSRRVKTDIEDVGERSRALSALRPVSFRYRVHPPDTPVQYGLIAEEVAEVYPELVVRDPAGAPETVRYHLLPALLLNELQRQERVQAEQARALAEKDRELQRERAERVELAATVAELAARLKRLEERATTGHITALGLDAGLNP